MQNFLTILIKDSGDVKIAYSHKETPAEFIQNSVGVSFLVLIPNKHVFYYSYTRAGYVKNRKWVKFKQKCINVLDSIR